MNTRSNPVAEQPRNSQASSAWVGWPIARRSVLQAGLASITGFWLTSGFCRLARAAAPRAEGQGGDSDLDVGRAAAERYL